MYFVSVLLQEAVTEDAKRVWVCYQFLNDQVVVLTCFYVRTVLTDTVTQSFVLALICFLHLFDEREFLTTAFHSELNERVAGTRRWWWTENLNLLRWQCWVNVFPGLVWVVDQSFRTILRRNYFRQSQEDIFTGQFVLWSFVATRQNDTVIAHHHFNDVFNAVFCTQFDFRLFDCT